MRAARALRRAVIASVTITLLGAATAAADTAGLVGAYGFEDAAIDSSPAANTGTIAGATRAAAGRFGAALSFDGVDDRVTVNDSNSLDLSSAMTLEAWVKPTATGWRTVMLKERPGGLAYAVYSSTDTNRPSAEVTTSATSETRGTAALSANVWSHVATTYDGATLRLFVNGAQVSSRAVSGAIALTSGVLRIGGNAIWGEYFRGLIDEVRIYNRALAVAEIQGDMNAPVVSADTAAPTRPGGPTATRNGDDVTLNWTAATDNVGVTGYRVYRDGSLVTTVTGLSYTDADRPTGTYRYAVTAIDAAGNASAASDEAAITVPDVIAPSAPGGVTAAISGSANFIVTWNGATDNVGVTGYAIHRSRTSGFAPSETTLIASVGPTLRSYTDVEEPAGSRLPGDYYFRVVALDAAGNAAPSAQAAVVVSGPDTTPPTVNWRTGVRGGCPTAPIFDRIEIIAAVADDRPGATAQFVVDGEFHYGGGLGGVTLDWGTYVLSNGPHVLSIVGRDAAGNQTTFDCPVTVANPERTIAILSPSDGATVGGVVAIAADARQNGTVITDGSAIKDVYVDGLKLSNPGAWNTRALANGAHTIRAELKIAWLSLVHVFATDTIEVVVDNTLAAPTGVAAEEYTTGVRLSWNAVAGAAKYRVYRGTTPDFTPAANNLAIETVNLSGSDLQLPPGTYFYKVAAVDGADQNGPYASLEFAHTADETAPAITLAASCDGRVLSEYIGPINGNATDDRGGDVRLVVKVDDTRIFGVVNVSGSFAFNWDTRKFADGPHLMKVIATDTSGNEKVFDCPWTVDNRELTLPITVPESPVSGTINVGFQPKADGANLSTPVQLRIDGLLVADGFGPYSYSWDTTQVANGTHTIEARMYWLPYPSPLVTTTTTVTVENTTPAPSGLIAAYGFEEVSGTTVADSSPSGSTGTILGATRSASGKFGRALLFDGINDLVSVPDANSLDLETGMTLSAWVRPTALGGDWRTVLLKSRPGGLAYALYAHTDTNRPAGIIQGSAEVDARGPAALALDDWTHLAVSYDGANVKLYVNGTLAATRAATDSITISTGALQIGGNTVWSEWFKGLIDEVRVYNRALTQTEIAADRERPVVAG